MSATAPPVVLVFAGTDPTGGAGVTADVLTLASLGCHPAVVVTAVTAQDTTGIKQFTCTETELVIAQARAVLEDMPVAAFKIGMLGSSAVAAAVASIVEDYPDVPLILDPVQRSGRGDALADHMLDDALRSLLIPQSTLITPNSLEARALAPDADTLGVTDAGKVEIEGFVSAVTSRDIGVLFTVGTQPVKTTPSTNFEPAGGEIITGARLEVEGVLTGGTLTATKISFK